MPIQRDVSTHPRHCRSERGWITPVEAFVLAVMGVIVVAIAVPSYVSIRDRANDSAARSQVRGAVEAAETYRVEQGRYSGLGVAALHEIDPGLETSGLRLERLVSGGYCIEATVGGRTWHEQAPAGTLSSGRCP